jgi:hypothetical protein
MALRQSHAANAIKGRSAMRVIAYVLALAVFGSSTFAAGINSRVYSCAGLQGMIAARGFAYIGNPNFQDFVVSGPQFCSGSDRIELRSVATSDNPECAVRHCSSRPDTETQ